MIEVRTSSTNLRANGAGSPRITGYAALFGSLSGNLGGFYEQIKRGAFSKSLRNDDVLAFHHHDNSAVLGRMSSGALSLEEDSTGLRFDLALPDTSLGRDIAALVRRRDIAGASFAFQVRGPDGETWDEQGGRIIRTLLDVRLYEVSTTSVPAYPSTSVTMARSFASPEAESTAQRMRAKLADRMRAA